MERLDAYEFHGIALLNKVKPHSEFRGPHKSGLAKMVAIGLGKHVVASVLHARGYAGRTRHIPRMAELSLQKCRCVFAVGIVQNA